MRMLRFVVCGALALVLTDRAAAVGNGAGATVLREVQAPDLSRGQDNLSPNSINTFVVSADLRPSASVLRPEADQRPVVDFPQRQHVNSLSQAPPHAGPSVGPQPAPQKGPQFRPQVDQSLQKPVSAPSSLPPQERPTEEVRAINAPFVQQFNPDGTVYQPPPPPPPATRPPPAARPPQQFRRPPPRFRRPRPPFGRPAQPGRPLRPRLPSLFQNPFQQLQRRFFGRPAARAPPHRRRSRRDLVSDVTDEAADKISTDVKQDRLGKWEMEYAMRKAADPASLKENDGVPLWAPLTPEARTRLAQRTAQQAVPHGIGQGRENGDLPIIVSEMIADGPDAARIPISPGDEVVIVRVPEEKLDSELISIEKNDKFSFRDGRALRADGGVSARQGRAEDGAGRSGQPWWARIPLLNRLIYRELPGEERTPSYTPSGAAGPAYPSERTGYDQDPVVTSHYDPYLSVDSNGRPYYRTQILAGQAHYENIPDVEKPVLNPTDEFVVPDNIEDPFRGGYAPYRPGYQYAREVPYLPSPYYPPGDAKYHRRQQMFPEELIFQEYAKKRDSEGTEVTARQAETVVKAANVENNESNLGSVIAQAAEDHAGEISIIDTGDHYAVITGDIKKFVDFDGSSKARSLADLLKTSESSDAASTSHSRTKRQAGLYPLLAPARHRPQRRPIQRRDDVGRFTPRLPTFRPPWESGRRAPGRPRGPRPLRPVSQRPNTRQPTASFQPPVPRPVFEQHEGRPVFNQPHERPLFEQDEGRPSFEQHNTQHPSFQSAQERPTYQQFDARPSFEQPAATPEFEQPEARPAFHEPASRPTVDQPSNDIITGPPTQFGGFQPVAGPVAGDDLQLSSSPAVHGGVSRQSEQPRPVVSPLHQDAPRLTVVTTVPAPTQTAVFHVQPSRPVSRPVQSATPEVAEWHPAPTQQQFASSEQHQFVAVSSNIKGQSLDTNNQATEEVDQPSGSWAPAALAGLSAILGGSQETTPEPVSIAAQTINVPTPEATRFSHSTSERHNTKTAHQRDDDAAKSTDGFVNANDVQVSQAVPQNIGNEEEHKDELKDRSTPKVVKRYRKRQRRPSSSPTVSGTSTSRNASRRTNSPTVVHRRRKPTVSPTPDADSRAAALDVKPATVSAPKRRVPFGARVRQTVSQRRRRPVARRPTTAEPEPIPSPATSTTHKPVTAVAKQSTRHPVRRRPTRIEVKEERLETAAPTVSNNRQTSAHQTPAPRPTTTQQVTHPTTRPTTTPTTKEPQPVTSPEQPESVSVEAPSTEKFRPVAGSPRHRPQLPSHDRPAVHRVTTPGIPQPNNVEDAPPRIHHEAHTPGVNIQQKDDEEDEDEAEDVHSQLESYLSRYAEKYGLGLVTSSPRTPRPTPAGRPAAPVSGLRWAHLAARSRSPSPAEADDEVDEYVTGEPDGDERVSVGSQYSYRVQLPPSRRVPPSLNSVRLRPKSKLAQLLGSSPRLRPSTPKPAIPWPAGYQPFTVSSTTPRPNRWAARRERFTTPAPTLAPAPTTGPAWSKYADEFTTTRRPTTESPATSGTRSRPIFIPPINRKRIRPRPLTLLHAGPRRPETTTTVTTTTVQPSVVQTEEPTEAPAVTVPAPPPVTEHIAPELGAAPGAEEAETTTDAGFEDEEDPLVASSEEPVGESSLFSVVYSKERPHVQPPQPEIFSRLNQFLVAHGEQPPTAPSTVSVTVGASPITVPVSVPADTQKSQGEFQASVRIVPVEAPVQESLDEETEEAEPLKEQTLVTSDGAVIVQAVPAQAAQLASNGAWVPTVQTVALAPAVVAVNPQPGTVVVYPEHMSQKERDEQWPAQQAEPQPKEEEAAEKDDNEWFEESEGVHDLDLSDDDLIEEVVYIEDESSGADVGKAARFDDEAVPEAEFLAPAVTDATVVGEDVTEVARPVHDPYGVFWTSPSGATNAEQAESQQLAGAFSAAVDAVDAVDADEADVAEIVDSDAANAQAEPSGEAKEEDERTVNLCLDGKCMFIYEPGRQVRVSGEN